MDCYDNSGASDFDFLCPARAQTFTISSHDFGQAADCDPSGRETYVIDDLCYPKETCCGQDLDKACPPPPNQDSNYGRGRQPDMEIFGFSKEKPKPPEKVVELPSTAVLNSADCCTKDTEHMKANRRFLLQFTRTGMAGAADRSDQCYAAERDRCLDFWLFVRNHPELDKCIKDGSFFHKGRLIRVDCTAEAQKKSVDSSTARPLSKMNNLPRKYTPSMEALKKRNEAIHEEEKQRKERTHKRWLQLARKSGQDFNMATAQKILGKKIAVKKPPKPCELSDCQQENIEQTLKEMDRFDEISNYPVKGECVLRQRRRPSLDCAVPVVMKGIIMPEIEMMGETEYYGEDDTASSSGGTANSQIY